jgi:ABC-2 type transport system ATP-binding protein
VAFLDEPTAGVDVAGRQLIRQVIRDLRDAGTAVLLTTHDLEDAEKLADRVTIVDRGRLVADGTPDELTRGGDDHVLFGAPPGLDTVAMSDALAAPVVETTPGEYRVDAPGTPARLAALTTWLAERELRLDDLRVGRKRLEDVFLRLTDPDRDRS